MGELIIENRKWNKQRLMIAFYRDWNRYAGG